jgi:RNA polymerase sigma factor (sigma-70 family)
MDPYRSDAALAKSAAAGDERAFSVLVGRYKDSLFRLLRRYVGDADEAYEAVHEAFIAAWGAIHRYDAERPFGSWIRTIAINKARDRGRRMAVRRFILGSSGLDYGPALIAEDPSLPVDESIIKRQTAERLGDAVSRLPAALKEPLLLTAFEGLTQREVGLILGLSVKTVETRVYRARKILAEALGGTRDRR